MSGTTFWIVIFVIAAIIIVRKYQKKASAPQRKTQHIELTVNIPDDVSMNGKGAMSVTSFSDPQVDYRVDMSALSCTCPNFQDGRFDYPRSDPRRLCKHLIAALLESDRIPVDLIAYRGLMEFNLFYEKGFTLYGREVARDIGGKNHLLLLPKKSDPSSWVNVLCDGVCYGYNWDEKRWSFDRAPERASEIMKWVAKEVKTK